MVVSSYLLLRALLMGEELDSDALGGEERGGTGSSGSALRQRLFAAFVRSLDVQGRLLQLGVRWTLGGAATLVVWAAILADTVR